MQKKKIAIMVLMGGISAEHEISLDTGKQIIAHLNRERYRVASIIITKKGEWIMLNTRQRLTPPNVTKTISQQSALEIIAQKSDLVFIALHGKFGEDGTIQCLLDTCNIPYTGSGMLASALGMDKIKSSQLFRDVGMNAPAFRILFWQEGEVQRKQVKEIIHELGIPLVVKPSDQGSSVGVSMARSAKDVLSAIALAKKYSPNIMMQEFIHGREITCGVIDRLDKGKQISIALPPIEIIPRKQTFYDYASKYADGGSDHLIPPPDLSREVMKTIQHAAQLAHTTIGCSGMSRSDFILGDDGKLFILEINTIPGMTPTSLLPQAAKAAGIDFSNLLDIIVNNTLHKKAVVRL